MAETGEEQRITVRGDLDESAPIWRYMDLAQLYWMYRKKRLWFPIALGLEDQWEGSTPKYYLPRVTSPKGSPSRRSEIRSLGRMAKNLRDWRLERINSTCLSCWHKAHHESYAMWKIYSSNSPGVAVQSTPGSLRASLGLGGLPRGVECRMGVVEYIDLRTGRWEWLAGDDVHIDALPFFYKRKELEYESEFRVVLYGFKAEPLQRKRGTALPLDPKAVIREIRISPQEPEWKVGVVKRVCEDLGLPVKPAGSQLAKRPII